MIAQCSTVVAARAVLCLPCMPSCGTPVGAARPVAASPSRSTTPQVVWGAQRNRKISRTFDVIMWTFVYVICLML